MPHIHVNDIDMFYELSGDADKPLVVWIDGAFGVGKTTVAEELVTMLPDAMLFDPELRTVVLITPCLSLVRNDLY